jgi:uncharacterized protein (DUF362 family)
MRTKEVGSDFHCILNEEREMKDRIDNLFKNIPLSRRTFLKCTLAAAAASCLDPVLLRKAAKAQGPKVVVVYDNDCTTFDTGLWWGSTSYIDQTRINNMVKEGIKNLTRQSGESDAWEAIIPTYSSGTKIGMKVNENNYGSGPSNNVIDWTPQVCNAIIAGLKVRGVAESDIYILEPSAPVPTTGFGAIVKNAYPNVEIYDDNGANYRACTWTSGDSSLTINHSDPNITDSKYPDQLLDLTYFIQVPQLKAHGAYGVTFTYKNLFGLLVRNTIPRLHDYVFNSSNNPLVDLYGNTHVIDKTVLIVGDGIYGNYTNNWTAPGKWSVFGADWPKRLFFATDPVAIDSVMYDFVDWQNNRTAQHENYLVAAANAGQGTRDHWNNPTDKMYSVIDFVQIDMENLSPGPTPAPPENLRISSTG